MSERLFPLMWTIVLEKNGILIFGFRVPMPGWYFATHSGTKSRFRVLFRTRPVSARLLNVCFLPELYLLSYCR